MAICFCIVAGSPEVVGHTSRGIELEDRRNIRNAEESFRVVVVIVRVDALQARAAVAVGRGLVEVQVRVQPRGTRGGAEEFSLVAGAQEKVVQVGARSPLVPRTKLIVRRSA